MKKISWGVVAIIAALFCAENAYADEDSDICEAVFREYGMRLDSCDADPESEKTVSVLQFENAQRESHIFFVAGGYQLSSAERLHLQKMAKVLDTGPFQKTCIRLLGHSDSIGGKAANKRLSERRAQNVYDQLSGFLADSSRIAEVEGVGDAIPLQGFAAHQPENRRVSVWIRPCSKG